MKILNKLTKRWSLGLLFVAMFMLALVACDEEAGEGEQVSTDGAFRADGAKETIHIVAGSENKDLEPLIQTFVDENKVNVEIDYLGSVDIMNMLKSGECPYDAVWPANSMWISMGDQHRLVKHSASTSISPVVLGIRDSKAEELGYKNKEVTVNDLIADITSGRLTFTMTSATQSNSGASAYIGFLYALAGSPDVLTKEHLEDPALGEQVMTLLSGVERSSGSSGWLRDLFIQSDYDAMINYESMIISANNELVAAGKEPMYVVYLKNGVTLSDSPLGYVDHGDQAKEEAFLAFQEYILSDQTQNEIQKTGRRTGFQGVSEANKSVFKEEWGIKTDVILEPITMPAGDVTLSALNLYQTQFRKPSLTIYVLDFSGSMTGTGSKQLKEAMDLILDQKKAAQHLLQANSKEVNHVVIFSDRIEEEWSAGGDVESLDLLNANIQNTDPVGGTAMYLALNRAFEILKDYDVSSYSPAIIVLSDGMSNKDYRDEFFNNYRVQGQDIPIYSIMFGEAEEEQLKELAELTRGKVFDGRENLIDAFKSVKGYN